MSEPATAVDWCRCATLLPKIGVGMDWTCPTCDGKRRYHEKMTVGRGGYVSACGECRYKAEKRGEKAPLTLVRFVTCTTALAGDHRSTDIYLMCDDCIDAEIIRERDADIVDNRDPR